LISNADTIVFEAVPFCQFIQPLNKELPGHMSIDVIEVLGKDLMFPLDLSHFFQMFFNPALLGSDKFSGFIERNTNRNRNPCTFKWLYGNIDPFCPSAGFKQNFPDAFNLKQITTHLFPLYAATFYPQTASSDRIG
jgi:hypothetical protein